MLVPVQYVHVHVHVHVTMMWPCRDVIKYSRRHFETHTLSPTDTRGSRSAVSCAGPAVLSACVSCSADGDGRGGRERWGAEDCHHDSGRQMAGENLHSKHV